MERGEVWCKEHSKLRSAHSGGAGGLLKASGVAVTTSAGGHVAGLGAQGIFGFGTCHPNRWSMSWRACFSGACRYLPVELATGGSVRRWGWRIKRHRSCRGLAGKLRANPQVAQYLVCRRCFATLWERNTLFDTPPLNTPSSSGCSDVTGLSFCPKQHVFHIVSHLGLPAVRSYLCTSWERTARRPSPEVPWSPLHPFGTPVRHREGSAPTSVARSCESPPPRKTGRNCWRGCSRWWEPETKTKKEKGEREGGREIPAFRIPVPAATRDLPLTSFEIDLLLRWYDMLWHVMTLWHGMTLMPSNQHVRQRVSQPTQLKPVVCAWIRGHSTLLTKDRLLIGALP